jgi:hypothetical protein
MVEAMFKYLFDLCLRAYEVFDSMFVPNLKFMEFKSKSSPRNC